jgi:CheY-like chemotaxis protein
MGNQIKLPINSKIFILEDDSFMSSLLVQKFEAAGATVKTAQSGAGAFEEIKKMMPDVTLLDIMVPGGVDGFEVLRLMRADENTRKLPAIMLSNLSEKAEIEKAEKLGAANYMIKATVSIDEIANEALKQIQKTK